MTEDAGWALWETRRVFQAAVDGALTVHGRGSVHADTLTDGATNFHHLTGHYPGA